MEKSRTELLEYSKKILSRGGGYAAVARYLERNASPGTDEKYIMEQLRLWEKRNPVHPPEVLKAPFDFSLIPGVLLIAGGVLMSVLLWDRGLIGVLPFVLIASGNWGIFKHYR